MKAAAIYLRRSTDRQEQSISDQEHHVTVYAEEHGFTIVDKFVDDAISGTTTHERAAFKRMIDAAQSPTRRFTHILVYDVKRFGRIDNDEAGYFRHLLRNCGVEVVYTSERLTGGDSDELLLPVLQWNARRESKDLSKVTIRGQLSIVEGGWWMGGVPPFGYDLMYYDSQNQPLQRVHFHHTGCKEVYTPEGKLLRVIPRGEMLMKSKRDKARLIRGNPKEVAIVQRIFIDFVEHDFGYKKIASRLNDDNIPAPRKGRWARSTVRKWQQGMVRNILTNRAYAGDSVWNRRTEGKFHRISDKQAVTRRSLNKVEMNPKQDWIVTENTHEPLIERRIFLQAQRILGKTKRTRRATGRGVNSPYLLSGLVICRHCSSRIHGRKNTSGIKANGERTVTYSYVCGGYSRSGPSFCPSAAIPMDKFEAAIRTEVQNRVSRFCSPKVKKQLAAFIRTAMDNQTDGLAERLIENNQKIDANEKKVTQLVQQVSADNLGMLDKVLTEIRIETEQLKEEVEQMELTLAQKHGMTCNTEEIVASLNQTAEPL